MKKLIPIIILLSLFLWWCSEKIDNTRQDTASGIIIIMSWNSYKRQTAYNEIGKNDKLIEKYQNTNTKLQEIKNDMEWKNSYYRKSLCQLIAKNELWNNCE